MAECESCTIATLKKRIEDLEKLAKFDEKRFAMAIKERNEARKERERWHGKYLMVKNENNALRKANEKLNEKLYVSTIKERVFFTQKSGEKE